MRSTRRWDCSARMDSERSRTVPTIAIKDEKGQQLLSTNLTDEGLGRYLKAAASLRSVLPIAHVFSKPLSDAGGARELALTLDSEVAGRQEQRAFHHGRRQRQDRASRVGQRDLRRVATCKRRLPSPTGPRSAR